MFQLGVFFIVANYADNVETHLVDNAFSLDIIVGCIADVAYFLYVYGIVGFCHYVACAGFHLNKHYRCAIASACNDVDVAVSVAPVALDYLVALLAQIVGSQVLAPFARVVMLCHAVSFIGVVQR